MDNFKMLKRAGLADGSFDFDQQAEINDLSKKTVKKIIAARKNKKPKMLKNCPTCGRKLRAKHRMLGRLVGGGGMQGSLEGGGGMQGSLDEGGGMQG